MGRINNFEEVDEMRILVFESDDLARVLGRGQPSEAPKQAPRKKRRTSKTRAKANASTKRKAPVKRKAKKRRSSSSDEWTL